MSASKDNNHKKKEKISDGKITENRKQKSTLGTNFGARAPLTLRNEATTLLQKELTASTVARLTSNDVRAIFARTTLAKGDAVLGAVSLRRAISLFL